VWCLQHRTVSGDFVSRDLKNGSLDILMSPVFRILKLILATVDA